MRLPRNPAERRTNRQAIHELVATREHDDRLRPLIVPAGRGPESFAEFARSWPASS